MKPSTMPTTTTTTTSSSKSNGIPMLLRPAFPEELSWGFLGLYGLVLYFFGLCVKCCLYDFSNVEKMLAFYGTYHREPRNQFIHFVGVPIILWTIVIISAHLVLPPFLGSRRSLFLTIPRPHYVNMGTLWILLYAALYLYLDVVGAILYAPFLYLYYSTALHWISKDQLQQYQQQEQLLSKKMDHNSGDSRSSTNANWMGSGAVMWYAVVFHILSWYIQIHPGHAIIEGASPAVLTNVGGALMAAPLFAFYEGIWAVGLRSELHARIQERIAHYTLELCSRNVDALRACQSVLLS